MNKGFFYKNSLSIAFLTLFIIALAGQYYFGWKENNAELQEMGNEGLALLAYLKSGHFIAATFENFQSEFLQMMLYVVLTISLRQIGSAESKSLTEKEEVDRDPKPGPEAPALVNKGGWRLKLYQHSLTIAFALLFLISWGMHLYGSFEQFNHERIIKQELPLTLANFLQEPEFWFESFQNWQSEFLSVASIVILSIFLRQKGSPESKPVDAPHTETGK
ncbi:DUF6766 family protein [Sphingobacterium pedocola]|uniref:Transmembrane protein n=1 Tax=Sphingobacterium pedocola TaxID=2082722 RepID=A0ABR9TAR5_9SPHI|nr:DUF6766 family protein [Sphingobacterium pedocola]MBE8722460.1 hypothetical protein [Sphingobacterium pedocola]